MLTDFILWAAKNASVVRTRPMFVQTLLSDDQADHYTQVELQDGSIRPLTQDERLGRSALPSAAKVFQTTSLTSKGSQSTDAPFEFESRTYRPPDHKHWSASYPAGMERLRDAKRIVASGNNIRFKRYFAEFPFAQVDNRWNDVGLFEGSYVVQTSPSVIQRCILMTTDPGDLVLDPTCGSGTTAYVAEQWGRRWITIDTSRVPFALARQRLLNSDVSLVRTEGRFTRPWAVVSCTSGSRTARVKKSAVSSPTSPSSRSQTTNLLTKRSR